MEFKQQHRNLKNYRKEHFAFANQMLQRLHVAGDGALDGWTSTPEPVCLRSDPEFESSKKFSNSSDCTVRSFHFPF